MPSLEDILKKTKLKSEQVKPTRKPPSIATEDRPYSFSSSNQPEKINDQMPSISNDAIQTRHKPNTNLTRTKKNAFIKTKHKLDTNLTQEKTADLNKPDTNLTQIIQETQHKPNTNLTQAKKDLAKETEHKPDTILTQITSIALNPASIESIQTIQETQHKLDTNQTQNEKNNSNQTEHKPDTNLTQTKHISALVGIQKQLLLFIFEECKKSTLHTTEPLTVDYLAHSLTIPRGSIQTSMARLCDKKFIKVTRFKNGRGGWTIYEVETEIYNQLLALETQHKPNTNSTQS